MELKFADLYEFCPTCDGEKAITTQEPGRPATRNRIDCKKCGATGGKPTPTGRAILDLLAVAKVTGLIH